MASLMFKLLILWRIPDSNRPPLDCEPNALPDELNPQLYGCKIT